MVIGRKWGQKQSWMPTANPQPLITLNPFRGKIDKIWPDFETLLRSLMNVGWMAAGNQPQFLQLYLLDEALQFFRTSPELTRDNFDLTITALRNHYSNTNLRELHKVQLQNLKLEHKTGNPEDFLVKVQTKATQIYPDPVLAPIPPANPPSDQGEIERLAAAPAPNQVVLNNAVKKRNRRFEEKFTYAIPNFVKRKLLEQNEAATVQDLCTVAERQMVFFQLCPSGYWSRDAFNGVSSSLSDNLVGALAKLTQQQDELKQQQTDFSNRISSLNIQQTPNQNDIRNNQAQYRGSNRFNNSWEIRGPGNFNRGRRIFNNNRGFYGINYIRFNHPQTQESSNNGHIAQTTYSKQNCYTCGYPNQNARDCNQRKPEIPSQQIPY